MKLTEAIKELELMTTGKTVGKPCNLSLALQLGIEALERLEDWRKGKVLNPDFMLPSETEE